MTVYVDSESKIRAVNSTNDETLTKVEITDGTFDGWSVAKICCYKVQINDGRVTMMTPYIDSRLIDYMDTLGKQNEALQSIVSENDAAIIELADMVAGMEEQNG